MTNKQMRKLSKVVSVNNLDVTDYLKSKLNDMGYDKVYQLLNNRTMDKYNLIQNKLNKTHITMLIDSLVKLGLMEWVKEYNCSCWMCEDEPWHYSKVGQFI
jgi:hypothetical protein